LPHHPVWRFVGTRPTRRRDGARLRGPSATRPGRSPRAGALRTGTPLATARRRFAHFLILVPRRIHAPPFSGHPTRPPPAGPPNWVAGWEFPPWGPTPWGRAAPKLVRNYRGRRKWGNRRRRCAGDRRAGRRAAANMARRPKTKLDFLSAAQRGELLTTPALAARQFGRVVYGAGFRRQSARAWVRTPLCHWRSSNARTAAVPLPAACEFRVRLPAATGSGESAEEPRSRAPLRRRVGRVPAKTPTVGLEPTTARSGAARCASLSVTG
jgi:hypothetical protein